jgi:hypothetical protein
LVACGTPEEVAKSKRSQTAPFLAALLKHAKGADAPVMEALPVPAAKKRPVTPRKRAAVC